MKRSTLLNKLIFNHLPPDNLSNPALWSRLQSKGLLTSEGNGWNAMGPIWDKEKIKKLSDKTKLEIVSELVSVNVKWFDIIDPDE